jgi:hypothetical protein
MKFLASKGIGTGAKHLLTNPDALKKGLIENWAKNVANEIAATAVPLEGALKTFVENAPFEIFGPMAVEYVLQDLEGTAYCAQQFGGCLAARPPSAPPPANPLPRENRYATHLFTVYAERRGVGTIDLASLDTDPATADISTHADSSSIVRNRLRSLRATQRDQEPSRDSSKTC